MLKIRLQRVGRKNDPSFRLIVADSRKDSQSGKIIEVLGSYDARKGQPQVKADRIKHWLSMGAQASGTVHNILVDQKVIEGKKVNVLPKRKPKTAEELKAAEPVAPKIEEKIVEEKTEEKEEKKEEVAIEAPVEAAS